MAIRKTSRSRSRSKSSNRSSRSHSRSQSRGSKYERESSRSRSRSSSKRSEHAEKPEVKDENQVVAVENKQESFEDKPVENGNHSEEVKKVEQNGKKSRSASRSRSRSRSRSARSRSRSRRSGRKSRKRRHSSSSRSRSFSRSRSRSYRRSRSRSNGRRSRRGYRSHRRSYSRSRSRSPYYRRQNPSPCRVLGVFGLNFKTEERDLKRAFEKYGRLEKVKLVTDPRTNRSRGFAFIYFDCVEDAEEAKEKVHGQEIDGNRVRVEYSISNREHHPTPGVYMGRRAPPKYDDYKRRSRYSDSRSRSRTRSRSRSRSYDRRRRSYSRDY